MSTAFADCLILNTVMASRALARRYDKVLKPFDVSVIQFTVLMTVRNSQGVSVNGMAGRIFMDRTTLLRNLDVLARRDLVSASRPEKGNIKNYRLTNAGDALLDELIPRWHQAQAEIRTLLKGNDPEQILHALRVLTKG